MGMTGMAHMDIYGKADEAEAVATIHRALELGGNFLDTADLYGPLVNEQLVAKATKGRRHDYLLATKFGWEIDGNGQITWKFRADKEYVKKAAERSLRNLGTDYIDLYYLHRLDPNTPIEETVGAMSELLKNLTGQNAQQHIHRFVIDKAKELLAQTSLTVGEIGFQLGFEFPQSFNRLFKSKTSMTPLNYRRSLTR